MTDQEIISPAVLKPLQAARYCSLGRSKFDALVAAGEIPRVKIGRSVRFRRQDLDRFIERHLSRATGHSHDSAPAP